MSADHENNDPETACFPGLNLSIVPASLFSMIGIRRLDLSGNSLTRLPGTRVAVELPRLEVVVLRSNLLHVLEDVMALAAAPRLCELDLRDNPLRLIHNRLYLLETLLFHHLEIDEDLLRVLHHDEALKNFTSDSPPSRTMVYRSRLPRRNGFPMLQKLNDMWILDEETRQAEAERGRRIEYFRRREAKRKPRGRLKVKSVNDRRFDGSRMTVKQMLRNEARITAIPPARVLTRYQIDMETCEEVQEPVSPSTRLDSESTNGDASKEQEIWDRLLRPATLSTISLKRPDHDERPSPDSKTNETEPWNFPVSTFDDLQSDERQYVRYKSKHVSGSFERDDHFFESSTFVDCVAQCERSRRLTIRAVDLLTKLQTGVHQSIPTSDAAATLNCSLSSNCTRLYSRESFERLAEFQQKQVTVKGIQILSEVGDYLLGEHVALRQKTNQLLSAHREVHRESPHSIEAKLEESLSRVKLRNAVDLANTLVGSKEQKRMIQALIDSDAKVIEEERVVEEYKGHRQRLKWINARQAIQSQTSRDAHRLKKLSSFYSESPWQARNWKAKVALFQQQPREEAPAQSSGAAFSLGKKTQTTASSTREMSTHSNDIASVVDRFRNIETVEKAALDPLTKVNSHDLLVRCSQIRQNQDKHVRALALHRDRFLDDEADWEEMRQDPINVVRRHLRRKLYQDALQVQIGGMEYCYSPLFKQIQ